MDSQSGAFAKVAAAFPVAAHIVSPDQLRHALKLMFGQAFKIQ